MREGFPDAIKIGWAGTEEIKAFTRRVLHEVMIFGPEPEPRLTPGDLIKGALAGRRKQRKATKDRSAIKAARRQRAWK